MKRSIKQAISVFGFTLLCFLLFSPFIFSGELYPVDFIINTQKLFKNDLKYGTAYTYNALYYKLKMAKKSKAKVLALGTSRVMLFNDFYFTDSFYNAGGGITSCDAALYFLQQMKPNEQPEYLIIALDEYFLNENFDTVTEPATYKKYNTPDVKSFFDIFNLTIQDVLNKKIPNPFSLAFNPSKIGIMGKINNEGFEQDGSYYYGSVYSNPLPDAKRIEPTITDMNALQRRYVAGENINQYTIEQLDILCQYASEVGIKIIAFSPPLAPECYTLATESGNFNYLSKIEEAARPILEQYDFEYYNYMNVKRLNMDVSFFIDGFHGSESAYLAMLIDMLDKGSMLNQVCDKTQLKPMFENRIDNFQVK